MSTFKLLCRAWLLGLTSGLTVTGSLADNSNFNVEPAALGQLMNADEIASLPQQVFADGAGLPPGQGTAQAGEVLYTEHCASCHGSQGQGGRAVELVGDRELLATEFPDRGIAVYWPYAPTLFEYVYRSMPPDKPASWQADELYSIIAHVLVLNELIEPETVVNAQLLSTIVMPNVDGFRTVGR